MIPITADHAIDELFPTASAVLAEMDMSLARSAVFLTVEGGSYEDDEGELDSDEGRSDDLEEDLSLHLRPIMHSHDDAVASPFFPLRPEELVDPAGPTPRCPRRRAARRAHGRSV